MTLNILSALAFLCTAEGACCAFVAGTARTRTPVVVSVRNAYPRRNECCHLLSGTSVQQGKGQTKTTVKNRPAVVARIATCLEASTTVSNDQPVDMERVVHCANTPGECSLEEIDLLLNGLETDHVDVTSSMELWEDESDLHMLDMLQQKLALEQFVRRESGDEEGNQVP